MLKIGILWDMDGTILNTLEDLKDAVNYTMDWYHLPHRTLEQVRHDVGNGSGKLIELTLKDLKNPPDPESVLQTYLQYYNAHCRIKTAPYPGVQNVLEKLGRKYPMAVVSNKPDPAVKALAKEYFGAVYARGDQLGCARKPAPDVIFETMKDLGVDTCIYVGDSEVDVATAKNAGVPCLTVLWGFRDREVLIQHGASEFCKTPEQLPEMIEKMAAELRERK